MSCPGIEVNEVTEGIADNTKTTFILADQDQGASAFTTFKFKLLDLLRVFSVRLPEGEYHPQTEQELADIFETGAANELFVPDGESITVTYDKSFTHEKVWKLGAGSSIKLGRTSERVEITLSDTLPDYFISMKNPDTETFGKVILTDRMVFKEQTPNTNIFFYLKASPASRFEISNNITLDGFKWAGAVVNDDDNTKSFLFTIQNSQIFNVRQGISIVNGLGEVENFGSSSNIGPIVGKTALSFVADETLPATDYLTKDTKLLVLPGESGLYFRPTDTSTRYKVENTDALGGGDGLRGLSSAITVNSVQNDGTGKAQFNVTPGEEPTLGEVIQNNSFAESTYNLARPPIKVGSGFYVLDIAFTGSITGGSFSRNGSPSTNVNVVSESNRGIAESMTVGGFNSTGTFPVVALTSATFVDMDFTTTPISELVNQERLILVDADNGTFEYIDEEPRVMKVQGTYNMTGGTGGNQSSIYEWKLIHKPFGGSFQDIPDSQPVAFGVTENTDAANATFTGDILLTKGDQIKPQERRVSGTRSDFQRNPFVVIATRS